VLVSDRGGLPITISGRNFDSIYGYFGRPFVPLTQYPYIGIWVGHKISGGPEFFDQVSYFSTAKKTILAGFLFIVTLCEFVLPEFRYFMFSSVAVEDRHGEPVLLNFVKISHVICLFVPSSICLQYVWYSESIQKVLFSVVLTCLLTLFCEMKLIILIHYIQWQARSPCTQSKHQNTEIRNG